jgi:transcription initiation factor TFIID subunit 12
VSTRLAELLQEVAPGEVLDQDVEEFLQQHVDEFVESVTEFACRLAKHRKSKTLEARDLQLYLEKNWNIRVPGYGDDPKPARRVAGNPAQSAHAARLQAIAKSHHNL